MMNPQDLIHLIKRPLNIIQMNYVISVVETLQSKWGCDLKVKIGLLVRSKGWQVRLKRTLDFIVEKNRKKWLYWQIAFKSIIKSMHMREEAFLVMEEVKDRRLQNKTNLFNKIFQKYGFFAPNHNKDKSRRRYFHHSFTGTFYESCEVVSSDFDVALKNIYSVNILLAIHYFCTGEINSRCNK